MTVCNTREDERLTRRARRLRRTYQRWQRATGDQKHRLMSQFLYLAGAELARGTWALGYAERQQPWEVQGWKQGRGSYQDMKEL